MKRYCVANYVTEVIVYAETPEEAIRLAVKVVALDADAREVSDKYKVVSTEVVEACKLAKKLAKE